MKVTPEAIEEARRMTEEDGYFSVDCIYYKQYVCYTQRSRPETDQEHTDVEFAFNFSADKTDSKQAIWVIGWKTPTGFLYLDDETDIANLEHVIQGAMDEGDFRA
jgi:hypothetical protein